MKQHIKKWQATLIILLASASLFAVSTAFYSDDSIREFQNGELDQVTVDEQGVLSIAPEAKLLLNRGDMFVWDIARDASGTVYAATGTKGSIYTIPAKGAPSLYYKAKEGSIRSLAVSKNGTLVAATSPNGKLLSIKKTGDSTVLTSFTETYIWDMVLDGNGNAYIATGTPARVYRVNLSTGKKTVVYASKKESHFLCIAINKAGTLFFGSSGVGALYKKERSKPARLLFDSYEDEISCLTLSPEGNVYFGTGTQRPRRPDNNFDFGASAAFPERDQPNTKTESKTKNKKKKPILKNSLYRLDIHDRVTKILTLDKTSFYSLAMTRDGALLAGTGDLGVVYRVNSKKKVSRLLRFQETHVLSLLTTANGIYAGTGNEGKVYHLKTDTASKGTYTSRAFDCHSTSRWGTMEIIRTEPAGTSLEVVTRTGESQTPDATWSGWTNAPLRNDGFRITSPSARYIQYRLLLKSDSPDRTPLIQSVKIPFLRQNRAPSIRRIVYKSRMTSALKKQKIKLEGSKAILMWTASDDDRDTLAYAVYFRIGDDPYWRLLKENLSKNRLIFDTEILPDGWYRFKVTASDHPSNTDETFLKGSKESIKVLIDNTAPVFSQVKAVTEGDRIIISGKISDQLATIANAAYSLNAKRWHRIAPVDGVFDSRNEVFRIVIDRKKNRELINGNNLIIIRASDKEQNQSNTKLFFSVRLQPGDAGNINDSIYFERLKKESTLAH